MPARACMRAHMDDTRMRPDGSGPQATATSAAAHQTVNGAVRGRSQRPARIAKMRNAGYVPLESLCSELCVFVWS